MGTGGCGRLSVVADENELAAGSTESGCGWFGVGGYDQGEERRGRRIDGDGKGVLLDKTILSSTTSSPTQRKNCRLPFYLHVMISAFVEEFIRTTTPIQSGIYLCTDTNHAHEASTFLFSSFFHDSSLSKKLTSRGNFHIFFCSTPVNLNSVKPKLPQKYSQCIELVELHLPYDELPELPPHYHTTNGLPPHLMPTLKKAFDMASENFSNILKTLKPDLLIYDFLQPWAPSRALSKNIPAVQFFPSCAAMASFGNHRHCKSPSARFPFPSIYLRDYELMKFNNLGKSPSNGLNDGERVQKCIEQSCKIILIKTSREIEAKYIDYLCGLLGKVIVPVGSLVQEPLDGEGEETEIIKWLNTRERSSVVFVSFGTEYFLSKEEIQEIALGLELSNVCFIWVIRFPVGETTKIEEVLPEGFMERVGERGSVVEGWAPQAKIAAFYREGGREGNDSGRLGTTGKDMHSNVGGFVSHCGWSSGLESMKFGVPIIALPVHLGQPPNARLVEELGVGVEVKKTVGGSLQG
ncbi:cyanidin-3-O-glucoside 2-O-glucuronosyltransferase-like [Pyrus ussuriensis x Pyrus communis]|uniref:Cyanidin-3-O-glucoside 2-O-glucuronosyltransferase-like n=1 Tax=Pyrus ussuriensis x Pyrus communis TaxID=2448454 RepID=A0A5N5EWT8_9ROSA|nr:cyanidin-3-O-glucoside 2-O-glucuronosyltransferase-like [Pyrus ussuriensis x Pyrus communis]